MRLEFPNSGRPAVDLGEGVTSIGSASDCRVVLSGSGVALHHCHIVIEGPHAALRVVDNAANTVLNGRRVTGEVPLNAGDVLLIGEVGCVLLGPSYRMTARSRQTPPPPPTRETANPTMVRGALPRLVLRGLSGPTLGRSYPLRDGMRIGRSRECDVFVETQEISRQHARLEVSAQGVQVEDLGSTNGTFVNGKRVTRAPLQPGDELALDTVRFVLLEPGAGPVSAPVAQSPRRVRPWLPVLLVIALALLGLWLGWQWR